MPASAYQSSKWFNTNFCNNLIQFRCGLHNLKTVNDVQLFRNKTSSVRLLKLKMDKNKRELNAKCSNSSSSQASSSRRNHRSNNIACVQNVRHPNPRHQQCDQQPRSSSFVANPFARHYENAFFFNSWQNHSLLVPQNPPPVLQRTFSDSFVFHQRCSNVQFHEYGNFNRNNYSKTNEYHTSKNNQNCK